MDNKNKKKKNLSFVESVANNEQFQPVSLDELEEQTNDDDVNKETQDENLNSGQAINETSAKTSSAPDEDKSNLSETSETTGNGNEQKGKKSLMDILDKKPEGPVKAIPIPISIHSKISSLSSITEFGISDIAASVLNNFLVEHKSEILKMLKRQTQNEWK